MSTLVLSIAAACWCDLDVRLGISVRKILNMVLAPSDPDSMTQPANIAVRPTCMLPHSQSGECMKNSYAERQQGRLSLRPSLCLTESTIILGLAQGGREHQVTWQLKVVQRPQDGSSQGSHWRTDSRGKVVDDGNKLAVQVCRAFCGGEAHSDLLYLISNKAASCWRDLQCNSSLTWSRICEAPCILDCCNGTEL